MGGARARAFVALAAAVVVAAGVAACGEEAPTAASPTPAATPTPPTSPTPAPEETPPRATAPSAPEPPADAPEDAGGGTGGPESAPGGAGDEEPARVVRGLTIATGGLTPAALRVPAFLALELTVRNRTSDEVALSLSGVRSAQGPVVEAGATERWRLPGLRPGRYVVSAGEAGETVLVARG